MAPLLLTARWVFLDADRPLEHAGVLVRRGRIVRILTGANAVRRCARSEGVPPIDLGDRVLAPGFVNAHAHLELTGLAGKLPRRGTFASWIRALVRERALLSPADLRSAVRSGARRLLESGTTTVGDIDSSGASETVSAGRPPNGDLRVRIYREALDVGDPRRARAALARIARRFPRSALAVPGLSPHAPYTVSDELLRSIAALAGWKRWPIAVHWAETEEEVEWLARSRGPLRKILPPPGGRTGSGADGLSMLARAGLLAPSFAPGLALVHGNHPLEGDVERVARSGATLVHCPGTHAFFRRAPFDLRRWLDAGVEVALGTDGLSSNFDLDLRAEMARLRASHPSIPPRKVFEMATRAGARALALSGSVGAIETGAFADLVLHAFPGVSARGRASAKVLLDALTLGRSRVDAVWIGGEPRLGSPDFPPRVSESGVTIAE